MRLMLDRDVDPRTHTYALLIGSMVQCRKHDDDGLLGKGTATDSSVPLTVNGF